MIAPIYFNLVLQILYIFRDAEMKVATAANTFKNKALVVTVSYASLMMLGIYLGFFQYTVLSMTEKFSLSAGMLGLLVAMQSIGMFLSPFLLGVLSGKIGKKKTVIIAYGLMVFGMSLAGLSPSIYIYIGSVLFIGAGYAVTEATLSAVLTDEFHERSSMHLNFSQVFFSLGAFTGPLIAKALIEGVGIYFQNLYFLIAIPFLVFALLFFFTRHYNDEINHEKPHTLRVLKHLKHRVILFLIIGIFLYVGIENTIGNFADSYFEIQLSMPQLSATALSVFWLAMMPSRLLTGLVGFFKKDTEGIFIGLSMLTIVSLILAMTLKNPTAKVVMFGVCGFGCGPLWPIIVDKLAKRSKGYTAPMLNIAFAFCGLGAAFLPFTAGFLVNAFSQSAAYFYCAAACVLMLISFFIARKKNPGDMLS